MIPDALQVADWLGRLVRIPSVNPNQTGPKAGTPGEKAMVESLAEDFTALGAHVEVAEVTEDGRPNVYATIAGHTDRVVVLDVHTDTVSVEHMTEDPFDGRLQDDRVWGRGAVDTKASLAMALALAKSFRDNGLKPTPTLLVVGSISEETGGMLGAIAFREWAENRGLQIDQLIVAEPTLCSPLYGHKGGCGMVVDIHGEAAHSATPHLGRNAIVAAARAIVALQTEHDRLQTLQTLSDVGNGTITTALITGGTGGNVVPDRCTFNVGRRIVPFEDPDEIEPALQELIRRAALPCTVEFTPTAHSRAFYQSPDSDLVRGLATWSATAPTTAPYGTNALKYEGFAREMVVYGPGSIDQAHKAQEWVELAELDRATKALWQWLQPC